MRLWVLEALWFTAGIAAGAVFAFLYAKGMV